MPIILLSKEDKIRAFIYSEIYKNNKTKDMSEYTRECIVKYDIEKYKKYVSKAKMSFTLEESLFEIADEYEKTDDTKKRGVNRKAFKMIRRCCKGSKAFVLNYYRLYKDIKRKNFYLIS